MSGSAVAREPRARCSGAAGPAAAVVVVGVLAVLPYVALPGVTVPLVTLFAYVVLASMWNLLAGYGGMVSIGQQAYVGAGSYALLVLAGTLRIDPFLAVPVAAVLAGLLAIPTSFLVFRLSGGYFAIGTWVVAEVFRLVTVQVDVVGRGAGASLTVLSGLERELRLAYTYWLGLALAVGAVLGVWLLLRSRVGLALTAIRDSPVAAAATGVPVTRVKRLVYVLASAGCGAAGALLLLISLRVQPGTAYGVQWTALMIVMVVLGGIGTVEGPVVGALLLFTLERVFADAGASYLILLGGVAVAVALIAPRGLWGLWGHGHGGRQVLPVGHRLNP